MQKKTSIKNSSKSNIFPTENPENCCSTKLEPLRSAAKAQGLCDAQILFGSHQSGASWGEKGPLGCWGRWTCENGLKGVFPGDVLHHLWQL